MPVTEVVQISVKMHQKHLAAGLLAEFKRGKLEQGQWKEEGKRQEGMDS